MKNTLLKFIFICVGCFYLIFTLKAQPSVTRIEDYRDRYLWLQTGNPAGLLFNAANSFSMAETGYLFSNGSMRPAIEAASIHRFLAHAESYHRFKNIQLHGHFGYENSSQNGRQWQTTLQPEAHLINFGDTVAGRQTIETYNIGAGIAVPLSKSWYIGGNMDYYARTGRKHIDPRNQNNQIDLAVTPGIFYHKKAFGIGAHFSYQRIVEKISYSILNGEGYDGRTFFPLWFGISENFQNGTNSSRSYQEDRFGGAFQLWGKGQRYEWLSECGYTRGVEECGISEATGLLAGETKRQKFYWNGQLRLLGNVQHTFRPAYHRLVRVGYDNLQSLPEHSTDGSYTHHGRVKRAAVIDDLFTLDYTLLTALDNCSGYQKVKIGIEWQGELTQFFVYPATLTQSIGHIAFSASYTRQFCIRQHIIEIIAGAAFRKGDGYLPKLESRDDYPLPEINIPQKHDLLIHDFQIKTAESIHFSAALQYTHNLKGNYALFTRATVSYLQGLSRTCQSAYRLHSGVSVGLLF